MTGLDPQGFLFDDADRQRGLLTIDDVKAVACPTCGAKPGASCKRPSGHRAMAPHAARIDEAHR